jgi:BirA family biotin operon repressor/biotin-[acetyl-CoA-carboxylase] ligase
MSVDKGMVDYAVIGVGINCLQEKEDFHPEIADLATSLQLAAGRTVGPDVLAAAMVEALWEMSTVLFSEKGQIMDDYKANCITLGKDIQVLRGGDIRPGKAVDLDEDGGLIVEYPDGSRELVASGEVSVRGMYGYV